MFHFLRIIRGKTTHIDPENPDAIVTVINNRHSKNPFGKNYHGCCAVREDYFASLCFQTLDGKEMLYRQPHRCSVNFLRPKASAYTLWCGRKIELYEGKLLVGTMIVEEIHNPILDRNSKYKDQADILENNQVLNLAIKRSLEWGRKFEMPLDNKLMKSFPALSGADIEKVSEYISQVRAYILWEIYYPNWDSKAEAMKIDAKKAVAEKYPWISNDNLASLDSQGMYYAWHG